MRPAGRTGCCCCWLRMLASLWPSRSLCRSACAASAPLLCLACCDSLALAVWPACYPFAHPARSGGETRGRAAPTPYAHAAMCMLCGCAQRSLLARHRASNAPPRASLVSPPSTSGNLLASASASHGFLPSLRRQSNRLRDRAVAGYVRLLRQRSYRPQPAPDAALALGQSDDRSDWRRDAEPACV